MFRFVFAPTFKSSFRDMLCTFTVGTFHAGAVCSGPEERYSWFLQCTQIFVFEETAQLIDSQQRWIDRNDRTASSICNLGKRRNHFINYGS